MAMTDKERKAEEILIKQLERLSEKSSASDCTPNELYLLTKAMAAICEQL